MLSDAQASVPGQYTLRNETGAPVLAPDGQSYAVNAEFESQRQRYLDRLDAHAMQAGWSAERHAATRRPYSDPHHVARELAAEQYAQYLASPEYRRDLKSGARGGYYDAGELLQSVPFLQNSLGRLGFVFDRTGGIVHSPLFGDYRKYPAIAQAVREYTRARGRAKTETSAEVGAHEALETTPKPEGGEPAAGGVPEPSAEKLLPLRHEPESGLSDPVARQDFHAAVSAAAQLHPVGAVEVKAPEFYTNPDTRLFLAPDRQAGAAVSSDGLLVSAFGAPADLNPILAAAAEHATRINAYAVNRGAGFKSYADAGFRPVARVPFDPRYAPTGWSAALGTPDLVFMVKDPKGRSGGPPLRGPYANIEHKVPRARSREEALRWQVDALRAATIAPVSHALEVKVTGGLKAFVDLALAAIDAVHRDGALPKIPILDYLGQALTTWECTMCPSPESHSESWCGILRVTGRH